MSTLHTIVKETTHSFVITTFTTQVPCDNNQVISNIQDSKYSEQWHIGGYDSKRCEHLKSPVDKTSARTYVRTHKAKSKVYESLRQPCKTQIYCRPANQHWDACVPLRCLSLVQKDPPGVLSRLAVLGLLWNFGLHDLSP